MFRSKIGNILLATAILCVICIVVLVDRADQYKHKHYKESSITVDTIYHVDTVAKVAMRNLKTVDSILQLDKVKEEILLRESKRIKDSITLAHRRIRELNQKAALEKKLLKEKYEKHIDEIYKTNCIQRGGPEDTLSTY